MSRANEQLRNADPVGGSVRGSWRLDTGRGEQDRVIPDSGGFPGEYVGEFVSLNRFPQPKFRAALEVEEK
jgi:hypothetical protein